MMPLPVRHHGWPLIGTFFYARCPREISAVKRATGQVTGVRERVKDEWPICDGARAANLAIEVVARVQAG